MGKYRAQMSLPNHLFGTIRTYDDEDAVTLHRVATGMLVRVDEPRLRPPAKPEAVAAQPEPEAEPEPVASKPAPKKRAAKKATKKAAARSKPKADPEPEAVADDTTTVQAPSSVMTSWRVAD